MVWWIEFDTNDDSQLILWYGSDTTLDDDGGILVVDGIRLSLMETEAYLEEHVLTYDNFNGSREDYMAALARIRLYVVEHTDM